MINYTTTPFPDNMSEDDSIPQEDSDAESPDLSTNTGYESCSSSSGDEDSERCSICLLRLKLQPLGRPENCKHLFCLECITQWAKVFVKLGDLEYLQLILCFSSHPLVPLIGLTSARYFTGISCHAARLATGMWSRTSLSRLMSRIFRRRLYARSVRGGTGSTSSCSVTLVTWHITPHAWPRPWTASLAAAGIVTSVSGSTL